MKQFDNSTMKQFDNETIRQLNNFTRQPVTRNVQPETRNFFYLILLNSSFSKTNPVRAGKYKRK
jgi:hypothetical protein